MPPLANLLAITLPLMRVGHERRSRPRPTTWAPRLAALPRPLIGFLIGGPTGPFVYDDGRRAAAARRSPPRSWPAAARPISRTSRRTPPATAAALAEGLPAGRPTVPLAARGRGQPLSRPARPGRRLRRDWRQHLDAGRDRPPAPAARDLRAADRAASASSTSCAARSPAACSRRRQWRPRPAGDAGWRSPSIIWALSATPATSRPSTRMLLERGLAVPAGQALVPPSGEVPDDLAPRGRAHPGADGRASGRPLGRLRRAVAEQR